MREEIPGRRVTVEEGAWIDPTPAKIRKGRVGLLVVAGIGLLDAVAGYFGFEVIPPEVIAFIIGQFQ